LPSELPPGAVPTSQNLLLLFTSRIVSVTTLRVPMLRPEFHIIGVLAVASAPSSPAQSVPNPLSSTTADESESLRGDKRRRTSKMKVSILIHGIFLISTRTVTQL
jgi:hypothetical protein